MSRIRALLNRWLAVLGTPGVIGIGILLFSAGFYDSAIAPVRQQLAAAEGAIAKLQQRSRHSDAGREAGPLSDFYSFFPPVGSLPEFLDRIYAIANKEGLDLPKGEYRLVSNQQGQIATFQAVFPIRGSYRQLRRFIGVILNEFPFVSLDDLRLEKQRAADPMIDSQVRLTLYLRAK